MKIFATVPAYNEEDSIGAVIRRIPEDIITFVVDDGSTDNTTERAKQEGARVIIHPYNMGQGTALITGMKAALQRDADVIIQLDSDGQHNPEEIPKLLEELNSGPAEIVVGSRILGSSYDDQPLLRRTFLPVFSDIIARCCGYELTDAMSGFRAFDADALKRVSGLIDAILEPRYMTAELYIRLARGGLTLREVPIQMKNRKSGKSYKGVLRFGWGITQTILKAMFNKKG